MNVQFCICAEHWAGGFTCILCGRVCAGFPEWDVLKAAWCGSPDQGRQTSHVIHIPGAHLPDPCAEVQHATHTQSQDSCQVREMSACCCCYVFVFCFCQVIVQVSVVVSNVLWTHMCLLVLFYLKEDLAARQKDCLGKGTWPFRSLLYCVTNSLCLLVLFLLYKTI